MRTNDLVQKLAYLAATNAEPDLIDDAIVAYVAHTLRQTAGGNASDMITDEAEQVCDALQQQRLPFRVLGQICDIFRREAQNAAALSPQPNVPTAAGVTRPVLIPRAPASNTATSMPRYPMPGRPAASAPTPYSAAHFATMGRAGTMGGSGMGAGFGAGTNSAFWQMEAMQNDMAANNLMMEGAMLDATGNVGAGMALQSEAIALENQAGMDRMMATGTATGAFGMQGMLMQEQMMENMLVQDAMMGNDSGAMNPSGFGDRDNFW